MEVSGTSEAPAGFGDLGVRRILALPVRILPDARHPSILLYPAEAAQSRAAAVIRPASLGPARRLRLRFGCRPAPNPVGTEFPLTSGRG